MKETSKGVVRGERPHSEVGELSPLGFADATS